MDQSKAEKAVKPDTYRLSLDTNMEFKTPEEAQTVHKEFMEFVNKYLANATSYNVRGWNYAESSSTPSAPAIKKDTVKNKT